MTDKEIDEQVNMLIKEVETLRKKAKQTLKGAKAGLRNYCEKAEPAPNRLLIERHGTANDL